MGSGVCLSVCPVPQNNSRTKRPREVRRSEVKVTRQINAHAVNAQYLPNGKAYELDTQT